MSHFQSELQFHSIHNSMANPSSPNPSFSFSDFPDDVQLCILSFLAPSEIAAFACTCKHFAALCRSDAKLWFALCERRWGSKTRIKQWPTGKLITYKQLYRTLNDFDSLIGFWRRSGPNSTTLLFFEWGPSFLAGSRVSPSKTGSYRVVKDPFLWLTLYPSGETISFLDPDSRFEMCDVLLQSGDLDLGLLETELVPVNVSFMGKNHVAVEENLSFGHSKSGFRRTSSSGNLGAEEDVIGPDHGLPGSLPDRLMYDIYQHFANRTSPSHDRATRRQRKREKERQGRKKWESEHFLKIVNCSPTPSKPLQGLWKGICHDMNLVFYMVAYDDIGGIVCRRFGDSSQLRCVFWTSNTKFIESPFSPEEEYLYDSRIHLRPLAAADFGHGQPSPWMENELVSRIVYINSNDYDLAVPSLSRASSNPQVMGGRIWQYENGTFGFGFLCDNQIIDLKQIARDGCILDTTELFID